LSVDQLAGPQVWLPELLNWHPLDTPEHVEQLIIRYQRFGTYMDQYLGNLRDGIRDGRTAPRIAVERVIGQLRALLSQSPAESPLAAPTTDLGSHRDPLVTALEKTVYSAYQQMLEFLAEGSEAYLDKHARVEPGIWSVTDGEEIYATLAREHTTTELPPHELHTIGRDELTGIHAEMRAIMAHRGETATTIRAFSERLTKDPANLPTNGDEIVRAAEHLLERASAALPRAFGRLPKTSCIVKPAEPWRERDMPAAYYFQPSADGQRPGIFYINTFEPSSRPRHALPALAFHEAVPGHHLQITLAQEKDDLPAFRRLSAGWLANAFVEGWALYTERLADELGLYPDELSRFGMLSYQAWRACRLVVDTGLHHLHWSRQQAIDYLLDNVGLSELETLNEIDRYISWPGQALSYKIGQREIERVRRQVERRLGADFSLAAFHDALLSHAAVPLSTLDALFS
jgi:uncharacterized protein (DUF885 family)